MATLREEYKKVMNEIRQELIAYMMDSDTPVEGIALQVGLSRYTIIKFVEKDSYIGRMSLVKIKKFLNSRPQ